MTPFAAPVEDILFSMNIMAEGKELAQFDADLCAEVARHFAEFAEGVMAPLNGTGDREGAILENGRVRLPSGFRDAYEQYCAQGWPGLSIPEEYGGQGLGCLELGITSEIFSGANHAFEMTTGLSPGAARTLLRFGSDAQKAECLPKLATGEWLSTMALTEPGAGSDLSRIKCRAAVSDGCWKISGEKIFISGGDQDLSDGILHLVLARTSDLGSGGLSLFLCRSEKHGGSRNGVSVMRIEEKLGIHASPTCQLRFDEAQAELVGEEGCGLAAMFTMMNHARLSVALQGVAHASRATAIAQSYAEDRIQGKDTAIVHHPDVARMLDEMDMRAMGARGIAHLSLVELERDSASDLIEILTPVAKYHCSEVASQAADLGIQVLGGYGYLEEYGMAQCLRDARITRIYEGANGIHALALVTRHMRAGTPFEELDALVSKEPSLGKQLTEWRLAWQDMHSMKDTRSMADAFIRLTSELVHQFVWARLSEKAQSHSDPDRISRLARRAFARWTPEFAHYCASIELAKGA